jgi:hypothetical protein
VIESLDRSDMVSHQGLLLVRVLQIESESILWKEVSHRQLKVNTHMARGKRGTTDSRAVAERHAIDTKLPEHVARHLGFDDCFLPRSDSFDAGYVGHPVQVLKASCIRQPAIL